MAIQEIQLEVAGYSIAALQQLADASESGKAASTTGQEKLQAPRLLCIHGWLDNANSFLPLLPYLGGYDVVAIDLPGHGNSSSIGENAQYQLNEAALLIPQIVDALKWQNCHLIGHSLGGNLATIAANASGTHFQSLSLLESLGPLSEPATEFPNRLQKALQHRLNPQRFESRIFESPAQAVESRLAAAKMTQGAAELIIERQLTKVDGGWKWRFDPRHRFASSFYLTEEHVTALLQGLQLETLVVIADDGYLASREPTLARLANIPRLRKETVPGNHHMHMDDPASTAQVLQSFIIPEGASS